MTAAALDLTGALAWTPWVDPLTGECPQQTFLRGLSTHRARIYRGGNRTGKTTVCVADCVLALMGEHPRAPRRPPLEAWWSSLDWKFTGEVAWPKFSALIPKAAIRAITWRRKQHPPQPETVLFRNGSVLTFKSAEEGPEKYQGTAKDLIYLDEEHPEAIAEECEARLLDRGGRMAMALTPVQRLRWVREREEHADTLVVRASTLAAGRAGLVDLEALQRFLARLPEGQRRMRESGDYSGTLGAVYPGFSRERHVVHARAGKLWTASGREVAPWPLPASWPRYASWDFGFAHPTAVLRAAHDQDRGKLYVERCWYGPGIRTSTWAQRLVGQAAPIGIGALACPIVCDHDADGRAEIEALGARTVPARKAVRPGLELVERLLEDAPDGSPRLLLVEDPGLVDPWAGRIDATPVEREFGLYAYPRSRTGEAKAGPAGDLPAKEHDHAMDALRYLCAEVVARGQQRDPGADETLTDPDRW